MNNKKLINNISWSVAEKMMTEVVNTIITILLARFLMPEDYGVVSLVQVFISISTILVTCGLGPSLIQKKDIDEDEISTIFYLNFLFGLFIYLILFFIAPLVASFYSKNELTSILRVLAIKIPISAIYDIQHSKIKKQMEFKKFFFSSFFGTVLAGVIGIYMAMNGYGAWALVASSLVDQIIDSIVLFISSKWLPKLSFNLKKCKSIIVFAWQLLFSEFISRTYSQVRSLVIGKKYSTADLAYNQKGQKYTNSVLELVLSSVVRVLTPHLSNCQNDNDEMRETVSKSIKISCFIVSPILAGFMAVSNTLVPLLLTDKWIGCIPYIYIYCLRLIISLSCYLDRYIIQAKGEGKQLVKLQTIEITIELISVAVSVFLFEDPVYLALTVFIDSITVFAIYSKETNRLIGYGIKEHIVDSLPSIVLSMSMFVAVFFVGYINFVPIAKLIIQVLVGVIFYVLVSLLFRFEQAKFICDYAKETLVKIKNNRDN